MTSTIGPALGKAVRGVKGSFKSVSKLKGQAKDLTKSLNNKTQQYGSTVKSYMPSTIDGMAKAAGETMRASLTDFYNQGSYDAFNKVAAPMPGQMGVPQNPMGVDQQMVDPNMAAMQQQQQAMGPEAMQQQQMGQMSQEAGQMLGTEQPQQMGQQQQATPEEMQQVQNSGLTSGDIASAAKVIQTMAEMKANADMMGMQQQDPNMQMQPMGQMPPQQGQL